MSKILYFFLITVAFYNSYGEIKPEIKKERKWGYLGFSGGMFLQTGYIKSGVFNVYDMGGNAYAQRVEGWTTGIGGKISFFFNNHFRIGGEGYATSLRYGQTKNSYKIGWGGLTADFVCPLGKYMPFVGLTFGGGSEKNMILLESPDHDYNADQIVYTESPLLIFNPALGCEFFVSDKLSLIVKVDYMVSVGKDKPMNFATGPRIYLGIHFYHLKNKKSLNILNK